jgi:hypothetical protein
MLSWPLLREKLNEGQPSNLMTTFNPERENLFTQKEQWRYIAQHLQIAIGITSFLPVKALVVDRATVSGFYREITVTERGDIWYANKNKLPSLGDIVFLHRVDGGVHICVPGEAVTPEVSYSSMIDFVLQALDVWNSKQGTRKIIDGNYYRSWEYQPDYGIDVTGDVSYLLDWCTEKEREWFIALFKRISEEVTRP